MSQQSDKDLVNLERHFNDALLKADWKSIEGMQADDLILTNADGTLSRKSDAVESIRSGDLKFESIAVQDPRVQDFGHVVVITGTIIEKAHYKTTDLSGTYRFTDVWARRDGKWQLVAGHESLYPQK
jgi:Domain of unknown function (DUF4440)